MDSYLSVLNPEQRQAVLHWGKPLLILAGAGSGKTRVITTKICLCTRKMGIDPVHSGGYLYHKAARRKWQSGPSTIDGRAADP
jgi:DNA helicase-2/ATP-dependent DNA helicase PcrA